MKLVKIKDVRVGQIRKNHDDIVLICAKQDIYYHYERYNEYGVFLSKDIKFEDKFLSMPIIGKLGITHKIEDNKLVEIPRDEFQVDDVVIDINDNEKEIFLLQGYNPKNQISSGISSNNFKFPFNRKLQTIGIYGVTHEFVNDCEVKND